MKAVRSPIDSASLHDQVAAETQNESQLDVGHQEGGGKDLGHAVDELQQVESIVFVLHRKAIDFEVGAGKGLDHPNPRQVLLQPGVQLVECRLNVAEIGADNPDKDDQQQNVQGKDNPGDDGQPPVHIDEHGERSRQHQAGGDHEEQPLPHELADQLHVVGGAGHQLAGLRPVVIAEAEVVNLRINLVAQVEGHALAGLLAQEVLEEVEHPPPDRQTAQEEGAVPDHPPVEVGNAGSPALQGVGQVVDHPAYDLGRTQDGGRHEHQTDQGPGRLAAVGTQSAQQAPHGARRGIGAAFRWLGTRGLHGELLPGAFLRAGRNPRNAIQAGSRPRY